MSLTVLSWNLKGSKGVDVRAVSDHVRAMAADVVVFQEVQFFQARAIARSLGAESRSWGFKHWPIRTWPEGMAVIGVTQPALARTHAITHRAMPLSSRRRILQVATVRVDPASGSESGAGIFVTLINVHLSTGDATSIRMLEADAVLRRIAERDRPAIVAGDLNDRPGSAVYTRFEEAGLRDVWAILRPDEPGSTNWRAWVPGTTKPPTRRIDYVFVSDGLNPESVSVPRYGDPGFPPFASISDHLPVTATVAAAGAPGA
ncbi:MAG TPA: endonuclease/exonuclease/phosphatase family protein [Acidimicrobiales bacterium]|nr:endonuclease/exonuclease/phosphatase family protein [Acidimicrobiales bacterium]